MNFDLCLKRMGVWRRHGGGQMKRVKRKGSEGGGQKESSVRANVGSGGTSASESEAGGCRNACCCAKNCSFMHLKFS